MSVQTNESAKAQFAQPGTAQAGVRDQSIGQPATEKRWGFFGMGSVGGISRQPTSEVLTKAATAMQETVTKITLDSSYEVNLMKVDNTKETALRLSSIVVVVTNPSMGELAYHVVLLESSASAIPPKMETINGSQVQIDRFAADVYDDAYRRAVADMVSRAFPGYKTRECSANVCPSIFNWADVEAVRQFVNNAVLPCVAELEQRSSNFVDLDFSKFANDAKLQAEISFNQGTLTDYNGLPVRNDVVINLSAISAEMKEAGTLNNQDRSVPVARVGGFIDLMWAPMEAQANPYGQPNPNRSQKYGARFVMTNLENTMRMTVSSQLLALAAAMCLGEGNAWFPNFKPRPEGFGGQRIDPRDIGAINIEANVFNDASGFGPKIDTKSATFTQQNLGSLLISALRPGLMFALDVSTCGSDTWYNEVFSVAASGHAGANNAIVEAANVLTGGALRARYAGNTPVVVNDERILMGFWIGADGVRHDIREIDYLAILNLVGEKDKGAAQAWSDTFIRDEYNIYKRLDARKKMIADVIGSDVHFTQVAQRVTWTNEFLTAFGQACQDIKLSIRTINNSLQGEYVSNRGNGSNLMSQANMTQVSQIFHNGYGGNAAANAHRHVNSRW